MTARSEFRQALRDADPAALRRIWTAVFPDMPQPNDDAEAAVTMHMTRTSAAWLPERARFYSHQWLVERGLPSMLPEKLKAKAERYYANVQPGVGIALRSDKEWLKPALPSLVGAMQRAVIDRQELITADPERLKDEILIAKNDEFRRLFGAATAREMER
jgi:hypothetical protein